MAPKRSSTALSLLLTINTITLFLSLISQGPALVVDAAPISKLLSIIPPPSSSSSYLSTSEAHLQMLQAPPQFHLQQHGSFLERTRRQQQQKRQQQQRELVQRSSLLSGSSATVVVPATRTWVLTHPQQQNQQREPQEPQRPLSQALPWSDRTMEGHAVLDDEDDDAGNELLDTEAEGFLRPDADDEIEGTVEGEEALEDEEEYKDEVEDEGDDEAGLEWGEDGSMDEAMIRNRDDEAWRSVIQKLSIVARLTVPRRGEATGKADMRRVTTF